MTEMTDYQKMEFIHCAFQNAIYNGEQGFPQDNTELKQAISYVEDLRELLMYNVDDNTEVDAHSERFDRIFNRVLEWAEENAGWDCEDEARHELEFLLTNDEFANHSDDDLFEMTVEAWKTAE